jgi:hypothetical protein
MKQENKKALFHLALIALPSFLIFFIGIKFVLGNTVTVQNVLAYIGFSILLGFVSTAFYSFRMKLACYIFDAGILAGFIGMYLSFSKDMDGWEDLTGIVSLLIWIVLGFAAGLIAQLAYYLFLKYKNRQE